MIDWQASIHLRQRSQDQGPSENPRTEMVTVKAMTTVLVMPNSAASSSAPGANMVVDRFLGPTH